MGGCASKPKDLDTRKPHAPPEVPVEAAAAQEKKDGDENKETTCPEMKEPETTEAKPVNEGGVPVEVKPTEAQVEAEKPPKEVAETVVLEEEKNEAKEEKEEVAETVGVKEEKKEAAETVEVKEEKKEEAETVVPKEEKEEVVVPKEEKKEVAEAVGAA